MKKVLTIGGAAWASVLSYGTFAATAFAQTTGGNIPTITDPLGPNDSFPNIMNNLIVFIRNDIAIPLTTIMVLVGAFQMITSSGNPEKISQGRKTLIYAAIGFGVVILASGFSAIITSVLNGS